MRKLSDSVSKNQIHHHTTMKPQDRDNRIAQTIASLATEAVLLNLARIETDAAEAAESDESGKPVEAKLTLTASWPAGAESPKIAVRAAWNVRRVCDLEGSADATMPLPFGEEGGVE